MSIINSITEVMAMQRIVIELNEFEFAILRELARAADISVEEAARRAVRHVIKEVSPFNSFVKGVVDYAGSAGNSERQYQSS